MAEMKRFDRFELDPVTGELRRRSGVFGWRLQSRLPPQARRLLDLLLANPGEVVSRRKVREHLWGKEHVVADTGINNLVLQLRQALGDAADSPRFIETVPRVGYRFLAPVATVRAGTGLRWRGTAAGFAILALAVCLTAIWALRSQRLDALPRNAEARSAYLQALYLLDNRPQDGAERALAGLAPATALEPGSAALWALTARARLELARQDATQLPMARRANARALELSDRVAQAHIVAGRIALFYDWDFREARRAFERAVALEPQSMHGRFGLAFYYSLVGDHDSALAQIESALAVDPVSTVLRGEVGWFYFRARRYAEAADRCSEVLRLDPTHRHAHLCRLEAAVQSDRVDHAVRLVPAVMAAQGATADDIRAVESRPGTTALAAYREWHAARLGQDGRAPTSAPSMAIAAAGLGDADRFFAAVERAWRERSGFVLFLRIDPRFDRFRDDPRFRSVLDRIDTELRGARFS